MSGEQRAPNETDQNDSLSTAAARGPSSPGVEEEKNGSTEPPQEFNPNEPLASIKDRLARIVNKELVKMDNGEIAELSQQHNDMLHQLLQSPRRQQRQNDRQQSGRNGGRQRGRQQQQSNQSRKPRPHCTYAGCDKPVGHWESTCIQKARDNSRRNQQKRDRSSSPYENFRHRSRRNDDRNDDNDDRGSQAGSTNGDGN